MNIDQRLDLILESVRYCQRVRAMGMPSACYSKALREPIFFLWELRDTKKKYNAATFRSVSSLGVDPRRGGLVYDHAIPFVYLQRELLALEAPTKESVSVILLRHGVACLITKDEDLLLSKNSLGRSMPSDWDGTDVLARYNSVGIKVVPNPGNPNNEEASQDTPSNGG